MRRMAFALAAVALTAGLSACGHTENARLRMPHPGAEPPALTAYAPANGDYPSVGGDILKGSAPSASAAYNATSGANAATASKPSP